MNNFSQTPPSPQSSQGLAPQQESPISTTSPGSSGSIEGRAVTPTQSANNNVQQIYEDTTTVQQAGGGAAATALPGRVAAIDNQVGDSFEQVKEKVRNAVFSLEVSTDKSSGDKAYSDGIVYLDLWLSPEYGTYKDLVSPELLNFLNEALDKAMEDSKPVTKESMDNLIQCIKKVLDSSAKKIREDAAIPPENSGAAKDATSSNVNYSENPSTGIAESNPTSQYAGGGAASRVDGAVHPLSVAQVVLGGAREYNLMAAYKAHIEDVGGTSDFHQALDKVSAIASSTLSRECFLTNVPGLGFLQLMIERRRRNYPNFHCFVCSSCDEFQNCMQALKEVPRFQGKAVLLVQQYPHFTPVLIDCKGSSERKIAILDSIGFKKLIDEKGSITESFSGALYRRIRNVFSEDEQCPNFYVSPTPRQFDSTRCSVFSWNDAKRFLLGEQDFFNLPEGSCRKSEDRGHANLFYIEHLPPEYMQEAQSISRLDSYLKSSPFSREQVKLNLCDPLKNHLVKPVNPGTLPEEAIWKLVGTSKELHNVKAADDLLSMYEVGSQEVAEQPERVLQTIQAHNENSFLEFMRSF